MGWANCGDDSMGRPIGYAHAAICDHQGCLKEIDRGLAYACGGMHGDCGGQACEKYFCTDHLFYVDNEAMGYDELSVGQLCASCLKEAKEYIADAIVGGDARVVWE
jgi:hypothetical protein